MSGDRFFEGTPSQLISAVPGARSVYRDAASGVSPVRHLDGYAPFAELARARGEDVTALSLSVPAAIAFIAAAADDIRSADGLAAAAATFLGNVIARLRPDACWHVVGDQREVGAGRIWFVIDDLVARLIEPGGVDAGRLAELDAAIARWALEESDAELEALTPHPRPLDRPERRARYRRPEIPAPTFADDAGEPIAYGERWGADGPPDDAYERVTHPERFAPLLEVANALIAFLADEYDVRVDEGVDVAADSGVRADQVVRAVRLTPSAQDAAPLTVVFTDFPGVVVTAGVLFESPFPTCGCDACDETAASQVDDLESLVFAVAEGGFGEAYPVGAARWYAHAIVAPDGASSSSGRGDVGSEPADRLESAARRLAALPNGWRPWS